MLINSAQKTPSIEHVQASTNQTGEPGSSEEQLNTIMLELIVATICTQNVQ